MEDKQLEGGVVYETTNYSKFNYLEANRNVNRPHVQRLIKSMEKRPELIKANPVEVNEKFEIIDGQHRFQALMELHRPIYYYISSGATIADAQAMNALHRAWTLPDFAKSYAKAGKINYVKFLELYEEYVVAPTVLVTYMQVGGKKSKSTVFRSGELKIRDEADIRKDLDALEDMSEYVPFWKEAKFANTMYRVFRTDNYDHKRMLAKLAQKKLSRQGSPRDYLRELEDIYNYNQPEGTRLRLYV